MRKVFKCKFFLFVAVLFILAGTATADKKKKKDSKQSYRVQLFLRDGSMVDGFIRTSLNFEATQVGVSDTPKGKFKLYNSEDIDRLVYPPSEEDPREIVWRPEFVSKSDSGAYKAYKNVPIMMREDFDGQRVKGYIGTYEYEVFTGRQRIVYNVFRYYYKLVCEEFVRIYFTETVTPKKKEFMRKPFLSFPAMQAYFDSEDFDRHKAASTPESMLQVLDELLSEQ